MEIRSSSLQREIPLTFTFDDLLLVPAFSDVLPRDVDLSTQLTTDIQLKAPIVSAAMDTVTEKSMAIAMARLGGIGIIHKNMSIEDQADQVRGVKRSESGMIIDPVTLRDDALIGDAFAIMKKFKIGGIPIINEHKKLIGILTNRDLRFEKNLNKSVRELMTTENLITAPIGTSLAEGREILQHHKIEKLPVVDDENVLVGLITYKDIIKVENYPKACKDGYGRLIVGAALGVTQDLHDRMDALVKVGVDVVCIDTAHGHSAGVLKAIKAARERHPDLQIIGGNVATAAGAKALVDAGVNAVKVGVGPGSICTTRIVAGIGMPQVSAIMSAAEGIKKSGVPIIGDGGIRYSGDVVKALAAGASSIMAGSMFAGVEESPGDTYILDGRKYKMYRGMGSIGAMASGSKDRYFQGEESDLMKLVPEGIEGRVPYKGNVSEVVHQYLGGLRSGMGYCGAKDIPTLRKAEFIRVTAAGVQENHPHDVVITKEAPNYSRR